MQPPTELVLPDLFSLTPFPWAGPNVLFSRDKRESTDWMLSYGIFTDHKRARMGASEAELLCAYVYPYADAERLRIIGDFTMILFILDEITDAQGADDAQATRNTFVNALSGHGDNSQVAACTIDYLKRLSSTVSDEVRERFVTHCVAYIEATAKEARLREHNEILSVEEYTAVRRDNGGVMPCFDLIEAAYGISLPAEVFEDPSFLHIFHATNDMICLSNDLYSYAVEYESGIEGCSIITVLMQSKGITLQDAVDHVAELYKHLANTVVACKESIRSFGSDIDKAVRLYISGMEQWVYGNLVWSLNSRRYFGGDREEVKRTGIVKLKQRKRAV